MKDTEKIFCPVNGWDCPYWKEDGTCGMKEEEGCHPLEECDDYYFFFGEADIEEGEEE